MKIRNSFRFGRLPSRRYQYDRKGMLGNIVTKTRGLVVEAVDVASPILHR
jgi:hypothetical protein